MTDEINVSNEGIMSNEMMYFLIFILIVIGTYLYNYYYSKEIEKFLNEGRELKK
jgi:hypothetical protein